MTRAIDAAPVALVSFVAMLIVATLAASGGLITNDTMSLWAAAIIAGDGQQSVGHIVGAYPTIPFTATAALEYLSPAGTPAPALLASGLVALLAWLWYAAFRAVGFTFPVASAATALLVFHPTILRAAMAGPAEMLVALFLFLFGNALFQLRERGAAPEVIVVSMALLGLAFSHPMGAAIACAAVPFLVFAVRPTLVANSAFNVVIALVFPTAFSVGAFVYVSWVFPGDGWSFYSAPSESLSLWTAGVSDLFGGGFTGFPALDAALAFTVALVLGAPLAVVAARRIRNRRPLLAPLAVLAATTVTAAAITVATGLFGDPTAVAVTAPVLCALVVIRIQEMRERKGHLLALLTTGWVGGALALVLVDPRAVSLLTGMESTHERKDAFNLGRTTTPLNGVLVDTDSAPAVVVGRGDARGLLSPANGTFTLSILLSRLDSPFVAVPNPQSGTGAQDRLNHSFPLLYRDGASGYRLIYQNDTWRLYERSRIAASQQVDGKGRD